MKNELFKRITKPLSACIKCGAELLYEDAHPSAVSGKNGADFTDAKPEEIEREDFCAMCWTEIRGREDLLAHWYAKRTPPKPGKARTRRERAAMLRQWFAALNAQLQDNPTTEEETLRIKQTLYVVAHLLMKFRVFAWQHTEPATAEQPAQIFFRQTGGEVVRVESVPLTSEVNAQILEQAERFFNGEESLPTFIESDTP